MGRLARAAAALGISLPKRFGRHIRYMLIWIVMLSAWGIRVTPALAAGTLSDASVSLSDPQPSDTANYVFTGSSVDGASAIMCVQEVWSTSTTGTQAPTGFSGASGSINAGASTLINSSPSGWSLAKLDGTSSTGQNNIYQYTNSTGVTPSTTTGATFESDGLTNSSLAGTDYYLQLTTYGNINCTSSLIDEVTVTYINTVGSTLSVIINPTLSFSVNPVAGSVGCDGTTTTAASTGTTIPFGPITSASNGVVCQDLTAATNATGGYTIFLRYTGPPQFGAATIADAPGSNGTPADFPASGTEAYGYSTSATLSSTYGTPTRFISPHQEWAAATTSNAEIGYSASGDSGTTFHIAHQVGVSATTLAGTYDTTIIYTCTPTY